MKRNTYPVAKNAQAEKFREIFKDNTSPGRVKGINNSDLISLFPNMCASCSISINDVFKH